MMKYFAYLLLMLPLAMTEAKPIKPENTLTIELKDGPVVIELFPDVAPKHVERIKKLVGEGKYDGVVFHRVIDGFMAQTGDVEFGNKKILIRIAWEPVDPTYLTLRKNLTIKNMLEEPAQWLDLLAPIVQTVSSSSALKMLLSLTVNTLCGVR